MKLVLFGMCGMQIQKCLTNLLLRNVSFWCRCSVEYGDRFKPTVVCALSFDPKKNGLCLSCVVVGVLVRGDKEEDHVLHF